MDPMDLPQEYLQGYADFLGCKIDLSRRVLIPRPEVEFWTKRAIVEISQLKKNAPRVLDIFSGSGCVGVAVAKNVPSARVDFSDIDDEAVAQIKINILKNSIGAERVRVIKSDIFKSIPAGSPYDAILANPPYVDPQRISEVQASVLGCEPHTALFGGKMGMEAIDRFLSQAAKFLEPGGFIYMEFDPRQLPLVEKILVRENYAEFKFFKDQFGLWRFARISAANRP